MVPSLCESCGKVREIVSPKGSRFLLCKLSASDTRYPKYPPQPLIHCDGYRPQLEPRPSDQRIDENNQD